MEFPWDTKKCILCLREEEKLSRAHLFPEMLGGFLWSRTHCRDCNSFLGHEVEEKAKRDDSFRLAIERALAGELPELATSFAEGQAYIARGQDGSLIHGHRRKGRHAITPGQTDEGVVTQSREGARKAVAKTLQREGMGESDIAAALERFDNASEGVLTEIVPGLSIKHGYVDAWELPFDGKPVADLFPAAIAYHFLALRIRDAIYSSIFDALRGEIHQASMTPTEFVVQSGLSRGGYGAMHLVGTEQTMPHAVFRVQMFGEFIWRVHLRHLCSSDRLPCDGLALDLKTKTAVYLPEKAEGRPTIELP